MRGGNVNRRVIWALAAVLAAAVALLLVLQLRAAERRAHELAAVEAATEIDDRHLELALHDPTTWVRQYRPQASAGGYSLVLFRRRVPMIIDMNGRIVHVWPHVRAVGRARLDDRGHLTVIGTDNLIKEYDWEGRLRWYYRLAAEGDFPHHDLIQLRNGNLLVPAWQESTRADYLLEIDRRGRVVWEWRSIDHAASFPTWKRESRDPTHFNSVHELPPNRWFDGGDERFRPGNILISARHLNTVFIIDRETGDVVWQYSDGLDYQHEASMIGKGDLGEGLILLFNNGRHNRNAYRQSLVQVIDPVAGTVVWQYGSPYFFSSVAGTAQKLPGENVAVTSSHGGRVFEINPAGEIVWEWVPPYLPMRVERLAYDHCPQLEALGPPQELEVEVSGDRRPYIDVDLYRFALPDGFVTREVAGHTRRLLPGLEQCRELLMPPGATLWAEFGIDPERLGEDEISARFRMTVKGPGREPETILDVELDERSPSPWRGREIPLARFGFQRVELCVEAEASGSMENPHEVIAWANPLIRSPVQRPGDMPEDEPQTARERELQLQQLQALGYVQ